MHLRRPFRQAKPRESGSGVHFSAWCDIAVPRQITNRVFPDQSAEQFEQATILGGLKSLAF